MIWKPGEWLILSYSHNQYQWATSEKPLPTIPLHDNTHLSIWVLILIYFVIVLINKYIENRNSLCPKCGGQLEWWDSRCKDLVCLHPGCDYSRKTWKKND